MSEIVEKELQELKNYLINEYRTNGGTKDVSNYSAAMLTSEIESLKKISSLKKELNDLKNTPEVPKTKVGSINSARENQDLAKKAALTLGSVMDYLEPTWDIRSIEDERFLRDNQLLKEGVSNDDPSVVILRDAEGRLA